ncbi:MAG: DUF4294 domain-containing protein [Candidatus Symbiothrix sp.]|nr:DUF4294 domain-containing protein [Candidatus Symbiothrix sp.]
MKKCSIFIIVFFSLTTGIAQAQTDFSPDNVAPYIVRDGDTIRTMLMSDIYIYPPSGSAGNTEVDPRYLKMVRDVKKTLPYAHLIYNTLIETYEYMETLPNDKAKEAHLKQMEKDLWEEYKPVLKKLTLTQGKLLIKLVDRECNQSSYNILKAYLGSFRAGFWNLFASLFGASLKTEWEPDGKDAATERIVQLVEMGVL